MLAIDRGRPVARLAPVGHSRLTALVAAGLARPAKRRLRELPPPLEAQPDTTSLGQLLAEARHAER